MKRSPADETLLAAVRAVTGISVRAAADAGNLSTVQLRALTLLHGMGVANLVGLAEAMGITVSTASRMVDRLVASGWVSRVPSADNRREISLSLTAGGRRVLDHYDDLRLAAVHERLEHVDPATRDALLAALEQVMSSARGVTASVSRPSAG
jgi:DNA-binding MarR family transcriptional regulator